MLRPMHIPARILRKHAMDVVPSLRNQTEREVQREETILKAAACLIARFGAAAISFTNLATAIKISPATMRKHFTDLDALIGEMMRRHLSAISQAIGAVPRDAPDRQRKQRVAYIEATRCLGAPTQAHLILITYRTILAEDERISVEEIRNVIGDTLGRENPEGTLHLLDSPCFDIDQIEAMLTAASTARRQFAPPRTATPEPPTALEPPAKISLDLPKISRLETQGGPLCQPRKLQPRDRPERPVPDDDLQRLLADPRGPPASIAALRSALARSVGKQALLFEKRSKNFGAAVGD